MKKYPTFFDENHLYVHQSYFNKFDNTLSLILQHAKALYTPEKLLKDILNKLRSFNQFLCYDIDQIKKFGDYKSNANFTTAINSNLISKNYKIYVLYFDPINDIQNLNWDPKYQIYEKFSQNCFCPAYRFYNSNVSIIVLNKKVISLSDWLNAELQLDHQLNHLFSVLSGDEIPEDINEEVQKECIKWFQSNKLIYDYELLSNDFSIHMFSKYEFYSMTANICNVLSLYFCNKNNIELFNYFNNTILTQNYLKSNEFKKFNEPIRGAIIFAYICKKYSPERWRIVLSSIKKQLDIENLNNLELYLKLSVEKIKNFFNIFKK